MEEGQPGRRRNARCRGGLIGSPETIRNKLKKFETSKVDSIILLNQAGKNKHEHICEVLELFAKEVMPEFHAKEPEHQAWKQRVLAARDRARGDRYHAVQGARRRRQGRHHRQAGRQRVIPSRRLRLFTSL